MFQLLLGFHLYWPSRVALEPPSASLANTAITASVTFEQGNGTSDR